MLGHLIAVEAEPVVKLGKLQPVLVEIAQWCTGRIQVVEYAERQGHCADPARTLPPASCPAIETGVTPLMAGHPRLRRSKQDVDGRVKPGHDEAPRSTLDDRHRAGPSCGGLLDLHREADDLETG